MLGLSITAIGLRPIERCLEIFKQLQKPLDLDFLELAIGSQSHVNSDFMGIPLILHGSCLYTETGRQRLELLRPKTWIPYQQFIASHDVRAVSLHPPLQRLCTRQELEKALQQLEAVLQIPVYIEVMPTPEYWCSSWETLVEHPLLLDVSHVLIWRQGECDRTQQTCRELLETFDVGAIHLSHNDGYADDHDLIPEEIWFRDLIPTWRQQYWVTFESLPRQYAAYERLDKKRKKISCRPMSLRNR